MAIDIATARTEIAKLYIASFNRVPDSAGLDFWVDSYVNKGQTLDQIANNFTNSTEYATKYPSYQTTAEYVEAVYVNVFGRASDAAGKAYWVARLEKSASAATQNDADALTHGTLMNALVAAAAANGSTDGAKLANQASFAITAVLNNYSNAAATAQLANITSDAATITTATAAVSATANAGTTYALSTAADTITGTTLNDTINGSVSVTATENTLTSVDTINGGTGTDTLNVTATVLGVDIAVPSAGLTSIETVKIRAVDGDGTVGVDAATFAAVSGVTSVSADRSNSNVKITALANGASVGMIGDAATVNGIVNYAYATATADQIINISGGTLNTGVANIVATASAGVTKATINSTGAANSVDTITLDSAGANTVTSLTVNATTGLTATLTAADFAATAALTITGAGAVNLGTNFDGATIDASTNTGGVTVAVTNGVTTSILGGTGNDVITSAAGFGTNGSVNAGTGTDTLVLNAATDMDTTAEAAKYVGFETLRTAGNQDMSILAGITAVEIGAAGLVTNMTATQAASVKVMADTGASTLSLANSTGTSDVLSLTLGTGLLATEAVDLTGALTINGFETLNMTTNAGPSATAALLTTDVASLTADKLTKINLFGKAFNFTTAATTLATTIDASALTGNGTSGLTIAGNLVTGSVVTGSGVADTVTTGTGFATYNTGAGNDTINATAAQLNTGANYNIIDGGAGTDTLNITGGGALTIVDNNLSKLTGVEKIVVATTGANNQTITTGGWFDAAFKAAGVNLTTTTSTGTVTIDMTSFTGAATITATTVGTAGAEGVVSVQTGSGNDTVTVTDAAASNAGTISTFGGNDTIVGGVNDETITGGTGMDTMTGGGTTADTFVFAAGDSGGAPSDSVYDTITDFTAVASNVINAGAAAIVTNATATAGVAAISAAGVATFNAADTTLAQHIVAVEAAINAGGVAAAGQSAMWQEGANAFLFISDGVDGIGANDLLIKLVGLDTTAAAFDTLTDGGTTFTIA